jgi:hypothetical protein
MIELTPDELTRFAGKVDRSGECWIWTGERNNHGYGRFVIYRGNKRVRLLVHRLSAFVALGIEPPVVRHRCDNPPCIRPDHLVAGTQADNIRDAVERGRIDTSGMTAWRAFASHLPRQRVEANAKACSRCRRTKPLTEFHKNRVNADGRQYWCRDCCRGEDARRRTRPARPARAARNRAGRAGEVAA